MRGSIPGMRKMVSQTLAFWLVAIPTSRAQESGSPELPSQPEANSPEPAPGPAAKQPEAAIE